MTENEKLLAEFSIAYENYREFTPFSLKEIRENMMKDFNLSERKYYQLLREGREASYISDSYAENAKARDDKNRAVLCETKDEDEQYFPQPNIRDLSQRMGMESIELPMCEEKPPKTWLGKLLRFIGL